MRRNCNSGQILLIAAFLMALLILSTQLYVFDLTKSTDDGEFHLLTDFVLAIKLGSRNVAISSLANVSNGGDITVLETNLERWSAIIGEQYVFGRSFLNYSARNISPYSSGFRVHWGSDGYGLSSAYIDFTYTLSDQGVNVEMPYSVNVTTTLLVESTFTFGEGNSKHVNVTINLLNEGKPSLASNLTIYYRSSDSWHSLNESNNYLLLDYGNGTYSASFTAEIPESTVEVSVHAFDSREICVHANATSTQV